MRYATSIGKASHIYFSPLMPPRLHLLSRSHQTRPIPGVTPPRPDLGAATSNPQPAQIPARRRGPLCCQQIKQASVATHGSQPAPPPATCELDTACLQRYSRRGRHWSRSYKAYVWTTFASSRAEDAVRPMSHPALPRRKYLALQTALVQPAMDECNGPV